VVRNIDSEVVDVTGIDVGHVRVNAERHRWVRLSYSKSGVEEGALKVRLPLFPWTWCY
jgi:hypothetical protein